MLKQRLIFGILGIIAALAILIYGSLSFISVVVALLALIAMFEFYKVTDLLKKDSPAPYIGFVFAIALFFAPFLAVVLVIGYIFLLMLSMVFFHGKLSFKEAALSFLGTAYISLFFLHITLIRTGINGDFYIWFLLLTAWACDTFAYFAGRLLGRHKLCPSISPKKTVEGAVGGVLGSVICLSIYAYCITAFTLHEVDYLRVVIFAVVTAIFSQIGDLAASCIKREYGVKDYGNLIPGHGGILDRFDSVLLIAPLAYYLIGLLPIIK